MEKSVQSTLHELGGRVAPAIKNASATAINLKDRIGTFVRENPGKSLIGAMTAGFVTALIARRLS